MSNDLPRMKTRGCQWSFRLLMIGGVSPETCWALYKYKIIKFWYIVASYWIFLWVNIFVVSHTQFEVPKILLSYILPTNNGPRCKFVETGRTTIATGTCYVSIWNVGVKPSKINEVGEKKSLRHYRSSCSLNHSLKIISFFFFFFLVHFI
jgi:hypothetical protein